MSSSPRVRFAPSPTGYLHVGGARTALFNLLFARSQGGQFLLRIEDTDQERSTDESLKVQLQDLKWLGLKPDEGVWLDSDGNLTESGPHGPYRQSQRLEVYQEHIDQLLQSGKAYYCFMSDEEIEAQKASQSSHEHIRSPYRDLPLSEAQKKREAGEPASVRLKTPLEVRTYQVEDLIRGKVEFRSDLVGDFVLLRSSGMPVYNFSCVVDDGLMRVSHVFRAEEHLNNTLRQLMIYEALGWKAPEFGHISLVLGEDKQKLSKRHGAVSCAEYRAQGYLNTALINFLTLLGWSHPDEKEIFNLQESIEMFSLERINSSPAVFDNEKFEWMNAQYLKELPLEEWRAHVEKHLQKAGIELPTDDSWWQRAASVFQEKMKNFVQSEELMGPLDGAHFTISDEAADVLAWTTTKPVLLAWQGLLEASESAWVTDFPAWQKQIQKDCAVKGKELFMPLRVAVLGRPHGADLAALVPLISVSELQRRVIAVLKKASS